jgi:uncharacterized protein (DUF2141 family)
MFLRAFLTCALLVILVESCAKVGPPPGGPEDKTGPRLIAHFPEVDATFVSRRLIASLEFSEPVNRGSIEAALFLSPEPGMRLRYRWSGRTLSLIYLDSLLEDRTYVITIGSQAKDLRGNTAGTSYTIAFSTGEYIDRGSLEGWIEGAETPQSMSIWAYAAFNDTFANPSEVSADYQLQADQDGHFLLEYLKSGVYRVFAVQDRNHDRLWNPDREVIGIPPWDVTVNDSTRPWLSFRPAMQDTAPARVRGLRFIDEYAVELRTSRPVPRLTANFTSPDGIQITGLDPYRDSKDEETWHVFADSALSPEEWLVNSSGVDQFESSWNDTDTLITRSRADTSRPHILFTIPKDRGATREVPASLSIEFDEPVFMDSTGDSLFQFFSDQKDSMLARLDRISPRKYGVVPDSAFSAGRSYQLVFDGRCFRDRTLNSLSDTTFQIGFRVYTEDSLGEITGHLNSSSSGRYLLRLFDIKNKQQIDRMIVQGPGDFRFQRLPARKYVIEVIKDEIPDSSYSYGRMWPFQFSEPFMSSPDTISVRARWEQVTTVNWKNNP